MLRQILLRQKNAGIRDLRLQKSLPVVYRDCKIRAAEIAHHRKVDSDNLAVAVKQRPSGTARSGLRVVDDFVGQDIANVSLSDHRPDQVSASEFFYHLFRIALG